MGHTRKKGHIWKMDQTWERRSQLGPTWRKGVYTWRVTEKMCHTLKKGSHLEKWVPLGEEGPIWNNGSHLEKWVALGKKSHTCNDVSHLEPWSHLETLATLDLQGGEGQEKLFFVFM